jgi:hypothetical protein
MNCHNTVQKPIWTFREDGVQFYTSTIITRLRESCNSVSTCNLVTETELQLLFIGMINSDRVNNVTGYYALML